MKVLITGITGMAGSHLAEYLLGLGGIEVYGLYRWRSRMENLSDLAANNKLNIIGQGGNITSVQDLERMLKTNSRPDSVNLIEGDIADAFSLKRLVGGLRPDRIFHLAAQSYVPASWNAPADTLHLNIVGQVNLLEAVREASIDPLIHVAGSSEEYGLVYPNEVPVKETNPLRPLSPYAVSKVCQEMLAWQYHKSYGLRTVVTRGFNHTGPRRGHVFVTSSFAKQIAEMEKGRNPAALYVGDLTSQRDWSDVRDVVRAYWLALEKGIPGEVYNVGSGVSRTVKEMLDILLSMTSVKIEIRQDPSRLRPSDVKILLADCKKFRHQTGWVPVIPFEQTLRDLFDYWRQRV
ncbi:MAG: GDP-mannose 4,6-dehydratase [Chloroflexi bacterium]|nr:GDP-mannose 4,6-dehydratase [Chloroflexota bacterium]MCL5074029.1 GDP-mannose 4,6-dehydratase [Chloroflexota bacterium]